MMNIFRTVWLVEIDTEEYLGILKRFNFLTSFEWGMRGILFISLNIIYVFVVIHIYLFISHPFAGSITKLFQNVSIF